MQKENNAGEGESLCIYKRTENAKKEGGGQANRK